MTAIAKKEIKANQNPKKYNHTLYVKLFRNDAIMA